VDNFNGSKIELYLRAGVQLPAGPTDPPTMDGRPPYDTHYEIWIVKGTSAQHIADFDLRPAIDPTDPCFIEDESSRFPGLHVTQFAKKVLEAAMADGMVDDAEAGDIYSANQRVSELTPLSTLKAMTFHEPKLTETALAALRATLPTPDAIDDASNAARLAACRAAWAAHPGYYTGTDKTIAVPLNGTYYGMTESRDPRPRIGTPYGGGAIDTPQSFPDFDTFRLAWNFNDANDPRATPTGTDYMTGAPYVRERGVINVDIVNASFPSINALISIYTNLGEDDVHF